MTVKYGWYVQCPIHPEINIRLQRKTEADIYYKHHVKTCLYVEPPLLVELPFLG